MNKEIAVAVVDRFDIDGDAPFFVGMLGVPEARHAFDHFYPSG